MTEELNKLYYQMKVEAKEMQKRAEMARKRANEIENIHKDALTAVNAIAKKLGYDVTSKGRMKKPKKTAPAAEKIKYREQCKKPMPAIRRLGWKEKEKDIYQDAIPENAPKPAEQPKTDDRPVFKATDAERAALEKKALEEMGIKVGA